MKPRFGASRIILVYTMGKVGSSSIYSALQRAVAPNLHTATYHVHFLNHNTLAAMERYECESYPLDKRIYDHILIGRHLGRAINRGYDFKNRFKIITGIRDLVAVDISSFFQTLDRLRGFDYSRILSDPPHILTRDLNALFIERISLNRRLPGDQWLSWFDKELTQVMGLNVFATPFPTVKGWHMYRGDHPETLLIRVEDLRKAGAEACRTFLGIQGPFEISPANVGSNKAYSNAYTHFKNNVQLPTDYLEEMYSSRVMRHFYDANEISMFRRRWNTT